jgi:tetratricopeptide (TPR) repeat protein
MTTARHFLGLRRIRRHSSLAIFRSACGASLILLSHPAWADRPPPDDEKRAGELFEQSVTLYRDGRFAQAVELLNEAHRLNPAPVLLYNRALAYEGLGDLEHAAEDYSAYLQEEPSIKDRGAIEQRVATLHAQLAERERLRKERERAEAHASEVAKLAHARKPPSVVPWVVVGAGAAGLAAGTTFGILAVLRHNTALDDRSQQDTSNDNATAKSFATVADVAFIVGGAVAVAGTIWGLLDLKAAGASERTGLPSVRPAVGLGWVGVRMNLL